MRQYGRLREHGTRRGLLSLRLEAYRKFLEHGIKQSVRAMSEMRGDGPWRYSLELDAPKLEQPERSPADCVASGLTYDARLTVRATLTDRNSGEIVEQRLLLCRMPLMDRSGGFVVNGVRRTVIHQIVRAPGVWFGLDRERLSGRRLGRGRIIPARGPWIGFETNERDELRVRLNRGSGLSALAVLRLFGLETNIELMDAFSAVDTTPGRRFIENTLSVGDCINRDEALLHVYAEIAPGAPPNRDSAEERIKRLFFNRQRYSLSAVGRHLLNRRFRADDASLLLTRDDMIRVVSHVIKVSQGHEEPDDIDHLANRRVRTAAELVQSEFDAGLYEVARAARERLETRGGRPKLPLDVMNTTFLMKRLDAFFNGSKLCQITDETNPIAELTHKRRVTSLGPGGLNRQNAGVDPRDVHHTHYSKICPIETPEGQNIGLLSTLTTEAQVDEHGFLTTPARRLKKTVSSHDRNLRGRELAQDVVVSGKVYAKTGEIATGRLLDALSAVRPRHIAVRPYMSAEADDIVYINAFEESDATVAQCGAELDRLGQFCEESVSARRGDEWLNAAPEHVDYIELTPQQVVSALNNDIYL